MLSYGMTKFNSLNPTTFNKIGNIFLYFMLLIYMHAYFSIYFSLYKNTYDK